MTAREVARAILKGLYGYREHTLTDADDALVSYGQQLASELGGVIGDREVPRRIRAALRRELDR